MKIQVITLDGRLRIDCEVSPRPGMTREEWIESLTERIENAIRDSLEENLNGTVEKVSFGTWGTA